MISKKIINYNHEPDVMKSHVAIIINSIKEESIHNIGKKPSQIINDCLSTITQMISAHLPTVKNMKQIKYRNKKKGKTANY